MVHEYHSVRLMAYVHFRIPGSPISKSPVTSVLFALEVISLAHTAYLPKQDAPALEGDSNSSAFLRLPWEASAGSVGLRIDEKPLDLGTGKLPEVTFDVVGRGGS